jgi:hypothetical protein
MYQPHAIASLFVGVGALHVMSFFASRHSLPSRKSTLSFAAVAAAIIAGRICSAWNTCDQSDNLVFVRHGHAYLDHIPKGCAAWLLLYLFSPDFLFDILNAGSILFGKGDLMSTSIRYLQALLPRALSATQHHIMNYAV